ncbi:MAG: hypothetical protein ACKVZJ_07720 [Phycisphaerales bacterium]
MGFAARGRRRWVLWSFVAAALLLACGAVLVVMAMTRPAWFRVPSGGADGPLRAESFERRVMSTLSDAHPFGTPWTLTLSGDDAADWLNHRLPEWLRNQGTSVPWHAGEPGACASISESRALVGVPVVALGGRGIAWVRVALPIAPGAAHGAEPWSFGVGRLALPRMVVKMIAPDAVRLADRTLDEVRRDAGRSGALTTIRLDDGRRVLVTRVEGGAGVLTLTCRTEGRAPKPSRQ